MNMSSFVRFIISHTKISFHFSFTAIPSCIHVRVLYGYTQFLNNSGIGLALYVAGISWFYAFDILMINFACEIKFSASVAKSPENENRSTATSVFCALGGRPICTLSAFTYIFWSSAIDLSSLEQLHYTIYIVYLYMYMGMCNVYLMRHSCLCLWVWVGVYNHTQALHTFGAGLIIKSFENRSLGGTIDHFCIPFGPFRYVWADFIGNRESVL